MGLHPLIMYIIHLTLHTHPIIWDLRLKLQYESTLSYQEAQNGLFGYKTFIVYLNTPITPMY